jgi:hypothetical protein
MQGSNLIFSPLVKGARHMLAEFEKRDANISAQPRHLQRWSSLASAEGTLERRYELLLLSNSAVV